MIHSFVAFVRLARKSMSTDCFNDAIKMNLLRIKMIFQKTWRLTLIFEKHMTYKVSIIVSKRICLQTL